MEQFFCSQQMFMAKVSYSAGSNETTFALANVGVKLIERWDLTVLIFWAGTKLAAGAVSST